MALTASHEQVRRPRGRPPGSKNKVAPAASRVISGFKDKDGKPFVAQPGMHYVIVEKASQRNDYIDKEAEYEEMEYEKVADGPRKSLWMIPEKQFQANQQAIWDQANNRLRTRHALDLERKATLESGEQVEYTETRNEVTEREMSGAELSSELPAESSD